MQCLSLVATASGKIGPTRAFVPAGQNRSYVFACWVKTQPGFNPSLGAAALEIDVYLANTPQTLVTTLSVSLTDTANQWSYRQQIVNPPAVRAAASLPASTPLLLRTRVWNMNTASYVLVDNLRFSPVDALLEATVYDPPTRRITATLGNNGETRRYIYDQFGRETVLVGTGEGVKSIQTESYSRDLTASDSFQQNFPNNTLLLSTTSRSLFYDFHDGSSADWSFSTTGGSWAISGGELTYTGASTDPLGALAVLKVLAATNFAVRVVCTAHSGSAGVGNGDVFAVWDQTASAWKLVRRQVSGAPTLLATSTATGFRSDWIFSIVDGLVLLYAGGITVFAYDYQNPTTALPNLGKAALLLTANGAFDDFTILNDPQIAMTFRDGFGAGLQTVSLLGYSLFPVYGAFGLVGWQAGSQFYFALKDHLGSVRAVVDDSNQMLGGWDFPPFGEVLRHSGAAPAPVLFTGQDLDPVTGLYDFAARLYSTLQGRFLAPDELPSSASPYAYANNNPLSFVDPDGRAPQWFADALEGVRAFLSDIPRSPIITAVATLAAMGLYKNRAAWASAHPRQAAAGLPPRMAGMPPARPCSSRPAYWPMQR